MGRKFRKCNRIFFTPVSAKVFTKLTISQKALCGDFLTELRAHQAWNLEITLILSWPAGHKCPTYKESFQVRWDNSIPLFLPAAIFLEVSLFRWTSQNAFSRETAVYKWYCVQCCIAALHTVSFVHGKMHSEWFNGIEILQGRWQHGEKVGYYYPSGLEKTLCKWDIYVPLVRKELKIRYCEAHF